MISFNETQSGSSRRLLMWQGESQWLAESSLVTQAGTSLRAVGTQMGVDPLPYRLDYQLSTSDEWVTQQLAVTVLGDGWGRWLNLEHDGAGQWRCETGTDGSVDLPDPGGDTAMLGGALDCDLGRCPLTNTMPIRRHDLHRRPGAHDFVMAWVSVPDLGVHAARQRYEHVGWAKTGATVRYVGEHRGFEGVLELDSDAFLLVYPSLARRVGTADTAIAPQR